MNGFIIQWAIRGPSGRLYAEPGEKQTIEDWGSYSSFMNMLFGGMIVNLEAEPEKPVMQPKPLVFDNQADAEKKLDDLREAASKVGVDNYGGAVVSRLCSPFTDSPAPQQFADRVTEWLEGQSQ